eukprot:TRINITY_DN71102_c0_g1_i1.p1 TRINITY_DN71102_c0_g1~~TRINITY_DN71102_c0_g1_i1.p1  ORF type:complete len:210 (-),score=31.72 TRINITY_DN71102_c0_g1_i1:129-758(-)
MASGAADARTPLVAASSSADETAVEMRSLSEREGPRPDSPSLRSIRPISVGSTCEIKMGTLKMRDWIFSNRYFFELCAGKLRWWVQEEHRCKRADPLGEIALCEGTAFRWSVQPCRGKRIELRREGLSWDAEDGVASKAASTPTSGSQAALASGIDRYVLEADDTVSAKAWIEAIQEHIIFVDGLLMWPMPPEGRQGDVRTYGFAYPED